MMLGSQPRERDLATAAVYAAGALAYYLAIGQFGLTFNATPLVLAAIMLAASLFRPRLLASGILLGAWGAGVLLISHGALPQQRGSAVFMVAFGAALLLLRLARASVDPCIALESAAATMLVGGLALYGAFDRSLLTSAWLWALVLLLNAATIAAVALWRARGQERAVQPAASPGPAAPR